MFIRSVIAYLGILVGSAIVAVMAFELYVRHELKVEYTQGRDNLLVLYNRTLTSGGPVEKFFGYDEAPNPDGLFPKNITVRSARIFNGDLDNAAHFRVETNNLGFFSKYDYSPNLKGEDDHFNIVIFGDSMTGIRELNGDQWVDQLQNLLNRPGFLAAVGNQSVRTYNMGWPGAGFGHFWNAYERFGKKFQPDLIVVNYIEQDFPRTLAGHHLTSEADILAQAEDAVRNFQGTGTPTLFLIMPELTDLQSPDRQYAYSTKLQKRLSEVPLIDMRSAYPNGLSGAEITALFNTPFDGHPSDRGAKLYASLVAEQIMKKLDISLPRGAIDQTPIVCANILKNGSFEELPDATAPLDLRQGRTIGGWQLSPDGGGGAGTSRVWIEEQDELERIGVPGAALVWQQLTGSTSGLPSLTQTTQTISNPEPSFSVSFYARADSPLDLLLNVFFDDKQKGDQYIATQTFSISSSWQRYNLLAVVPTGVISGHIRITLAPTPQGNTFSAAVAGVQVEAGETATSAKISSDSPGLSTQCYPNAERVFPEQHFADPDSAYARLLSDPKNVNVLYQNIIDRYLVGKAGLNGVSYTWYRLQDDGRGRTYSWIPYTIPLSGGFDKVHFGSGEQDAGYVNLSCTQPPYRLENPDCYQSFLVFVKDKPH